ncbi:cytidylyltransferase [Niveomyces insectorum RCEF 264]|uniref:ethanolamine-phosphate cytidylyltransferase n=1 Tax=Niveomyces insectorum RCEF 264 TaxID=1081102 RepID=A0A167YS96_9HYPO|nr:cytidylyltransferase [Niveomyces insectorum RCEF 264]
MSTEDLPPGDPAPELLDGRLWVDGCFDFFHHGHAGAIVQARQLGDELYVGVHSDEAILENKGPTVMNLRERLFAVDACRWVTRSVANAPYVTQLDWVSHFGCRYVVHGDDITSDGAGEDCYRFVKAAGRFKVVKRTPSISTTDLVGRMLLCTKTHFIRSLEATLAGREGPGTADERAATGAAMAERMRLYATDASARQPGVINAWKGVNYPIMNIYERGLCVLQCRHVDAVVFGAPFAPTRAYLGALPYGVPDAVYHGPTAFMPLTYDPYVDPKALGIYEAIGAHEFADVNAETIVARILASRDRLVGPSLD